MSTPIIELVNVHKSFRAADGSPRTVLERLDFTLHVLVTLSGPDPRMNVTGRFIVGTADVEGQTMVKDHPMSELRL